MKLANEHSSVEQLATELLRKKGDMEPLGKTWYYNFLKRRPALRIRRSHAMDQARKDALDEKTLRHWFELYHTTRLKYSVAEEDTYNIDEKGYMKGQGDRTTVIVPRYERQTFSTQPGNREWVSVIECISTDGFFLPSFIIFEGKRIQHLWVDEKVDKSFVVRVSEKGWTDREIALSWLAHFDVYTRLRTQGEYRLLILDGFSSHVSMDFV